MFSKDIICPYGVDQSNPKTKVEMIPFLCACFNKVY